MSLNIDTDRIEAVLLADGWHQVKSRSFDLDVYEFQHENETILSGGQLIGAPSTGATWLDKEGGRIYCPLMAVLAVRTGEAEIIAEEALEEMRQHSRLFHDADSQVSPTAPSFSPARL